MGLTDSAMTIGVYTLYDDVFEPCAAITMPILLKYCERHGYPLTIATERLSEQRVVWDKIPLLLENLHLNEWSFWIDADVLITNPEIKLESFLLDCPIQSDFIWSHDGNGPNLGVFFTRNSTQARVVLSDAWHMRGRADIGSEQHAVIEACRTSERVLITHVHQKRFNSYPYEAYNLPPTTEGNWTPGDFAMHLPGMTVDRRVEIFTKALSK